MYSFPECVRLLSHYLDVAIAMRLPNVNEVAASLFHVLEMEGF